jgi:putative transposase
MAEHTEDSVQCGIGAGSPRQNGGSRHTFLRLRLPNQLRGIIVIDEMKMREVTPGHGNVSVETTQRVVSTKTKTTLRRNSLGSIIGQFKSKCTKRIHAAGFTDFLWQTRFYDHIVRDGRDLDRIRQYILANPANWSKDDNYSRNIRMDPLYSGENQSMGTD